MNRTVWIFGAAPALLLLAAGCSGIGLSDDAPRALDIGRAPPSASLLLRYDADGNRTITKDEIDSGLSAEFQAADTNSDNCLDTLETRRENQVRLQRDGTQASPLVDWNLDGCLDMAEFDNTVRSYFDLLDSTKDGIVNANELRGSPLPVAGGR